MAKRTKRIRTTSRIRRPVLPPSLNRIEVRDISVSSDQVRLEFHRTLEGITEVRVLEMLGDVAIDIQDAGL